MYDIRQFKPVLYLLLLLGLSGYALASQSPGLWTIGCGAILFNAWLIKTNRFKPLPRLLANVITVGGLVWVLEQSGVIGWMLQQGALTGSTELAIDLIGKYLVLLQMVKLYEQRGNRDYAQLLVLGLLLMVAGAINTASLEFGLLLVVYLFLSLYCCLLFHLKVETDQAKAALAIPAEKVSPATLRQDQRNLAGSMRRITFFVAAFAIFFAVIVFLFFPRGKGDGLLVGQQFRPTQTLSGFNTDVSFQQLARITQSSSVVAYAQVWHNEKLVSGNQPLLLRGLTLEQYSGSDDTYGAPWNWSHVHLEDEDQVVAGPDDTTELRQPPPGNNDRWRQKITLRPTGTSVLFALAGPLNVKMRRESPIRYSASSGTMRLMRPPEGPIEYEVVSCNDLDPPEDDELPPPQTPPIDLKVREMAMRPEVSGSNAKGSLAAQRARVPFHIDPLDGQIADHIESYLRTHYIYTLDLTDASRIEGRDPIVAFLYDLKRGHCEYFAGAMTLMCQSLGMQARMVVGFKCDEFNDMGSHYIVRQSNAHAWVEVRTADGWKTYDPTSGTAADLASRAKGGWWAKVAHLVDFLEYTYADNVIAYGSDDRQNLIQSTESKMMNVASAGRSQFGDMSGWMLSKRFWTLSTNIIGGIIWLAILALLVAFGGFFWEKWRLRRRAARIGITALPVAEQERLARQLAFYDDLVRLLGRCRIVRPNHLTPLEFCETLLFLPSEAYDTIRRLTLLFYRVRFGHSELSVQRQRRLAVVIGRLSEGLPRPKPGSGRD